MYLESLVKTDTLGNFIIENGASGELNNNNLRRKKKKQLKWGY